MSVVTGFGAAVVGGFDESGVALGMGASFIISSVFAYLYFRFGSWREKELFAEPLRT